MRRHALWLRGPTEAPGCPPPVGFGRRPRSLVRSVRLPGRRGCGERRAHTRAHTPQSMLSAARGTSCLVASGPGPSVAL